MQAAYHISSVNRPSDTHRPASNHCASFLPAVRSGPRTAIVYRLWTLGTEEFISLLEIVSHSQEIGNMGNGCGLIIILLLIVIIGLLIYAIRICQSGRSMQGAGAPPGQPAAPANENGMIDPIAPTKEVVHQALIVRQNPNFGAGQGGQDGKKKAWFRVVFVQ